MSIAQKIINDQDYKEQKQQEKILFMGSYFYKYMCNRLKMRPRTLLNKYDIQDHLIKDDSILI